MLTKINLRQIRQALTKDNLKKSPLAKTRQQHSGNEAEQLAKTFLKQQGLAFVEQNYRCRRGEIDLIFTDKGKLIFVEVRFRRRAQFGSACETIDTAKQQKLIKAAEHYLHAHSLTESVSSRFDAIGITPGTHSCAKKALEAQNTSSVIKNKKGTEYRIEWIKNAFDYF